MSFPSHNTDIEMSDVSGPGDGVPGTSTSAPAAPTSATSSLPSTDSPHRVQWAVDGAFADFLIHGTRGEAVEYMLGKEEELRPNGSRPSQLEQLYGTTNVTQAMVDEAENDFRSAFLQHWSHSVVMNITRLWETDPTSAVEIVSAHQLDHPENFLRCCVFMLKVDPRRFLGAFDSIFELSSGGKVEGESEGEMETDTVYNFQGMLDLLTACTMIGGDLNYFYRFPLMPSKQDQDFNRASTRLKAKPQSDNALAAAHMRLDETLSSYPVLGALYLSVASIFALELHHDIAYIRAHPILMRPLQEEDMAGMQHHRAISNAALSLRKRNRVDKELRMMSAVATALWRELDGGILRGRLQDDIIAPLRRAIHCNPEIVRA
ncbi:hypothetical protein IAT38_007250 [Cryptococcus sp. DSM 104549]